MTQAFLLACIFAEDGSTVFGNRYCKASPWSDAFQPNRAEIKGAEVQTQKSAWEGIRNWIHRQHLVTIIIISVIIGISIIALACIVFGCITRKRHRHSKTTLLNVQMDTDASMKQPLMQGPNSAHLMSLAPINGPASPYVGAPSDMYGGCSYAMVAKYPTVSATASPMPNSSLGPQHLAFSGTMSPMLGVNPAATYYNTSATSYVRMWDSGSSGSFLACYTGRDQAGLQTMSQVHEERM
ncbi:hypothetical protein Ciccas_000824 [Cichlidogyrus casuarinus]|uniref:Uncharacterized protein n=1 Tax=Cichlidogyrus casuarinus TaxID=1844966 RepID=A0ABD2QMZ0_9PLAT